jgi:hypothetical protein
MHPAAVIQLNLSETERELIVELLEQERTELPHEIHHTATGTMRRELERRFETTELVLKKLGAD